LAFIICSFQEKPSSQSKSSLAMKTRRKLHLFSLLLIETCLLSPSEAFPTRNLFHQWRPTGQAPVHHLRSNLRASLSDINGKAKEGSDNNDTTSAINHQKEAQEAAKAAQSFRIDTSRNDLYYDTSPPNSPQPPTTPKKQSLLERDRQIIVYHNLLQKNANDCSVCTVPDKIDDNKIISSSSTESQQSSSSSQANIKKNGKLMGNGITPPSTTRTQQSLEQSLQNIKEKVHDLIHEPSIELADGGLILVSSFLSALSTCKGLFPPPTMSYVTTLQDATLYFFAFGFVSRWFSSAAPRGTYFQKDPLEVVDIFVVAMPFLFLTVPGLADMMPSWLTGQTALINLRLLRVLRFQRILQDEFTFSRFVSGLKFPGKDDALSCVIVDLWQLQLARVLLSIFTLLSVATGLIYSAEHGVNPDIPDYFTALYVSVCSTICICFFSPMKA
jgi:hypothetical protein